MGLDTFAPMDAGERLRHLAAVRVFDAEEQDAKGCAHGR
jgi:hypothetical protein